MPSTNNPVGLSLDVRNFASSGDGWANATASNGATYSYKYSGGNTPDNNGNVTFGIGGGNAAITLNIVADARYQFNGDCISFASNNGQLSTQGNAPRTRVINDNCTAAVNSKYTATVTDTTANATVPCDPVIINQ